MLSKDEIKELKKVVNTLNTEVEEKDKLTLNEYLSYLFRQGVIEGLENKDFRNKRLENVEKRLNKLYSKFAGFYTRVERGDINQYFPVTLKSDTTLIGEILALEFCLGVYTQKYPFLAKAPFPTHLGWYGKSAVVYMKNEPTTGNSQLIDFSQIEDDFPFEVFGKPSEFTINGDSIDEELKGTLLLFFAEGAIPKDYDLTPIKSLVSLISEDLKNKYGLVEEEQPVAS